MAFVHGKGTKVLVNGYDLSAYFNNTDVTWEVNADETTCFGNDDRTFVTGLRTSNLSISGFYDATSVITVDPVLAAGVGSASSKVCITFGPNGLTVGNDTYSVQSIQTSYQITSPVDGVCAITLDVQGTDKMSRGISLHNLSAVTSAGNTAAQDQSNSSANGGVGYLHVTNLAVDTTEAFQAAIQDSPSCTAGVWADLILFTARTSAGSSGRFFERKTASGGVDRYVRGEWLCPTTSTCTFALTFERNSG
jgi:hypothetical protein